MNRPPSARPLPAILLLPLAVLLLSVLLLSPVRLRAQSSRSGPAGENLISGVVLGGLSGQPIAQATVTLRGTRDYEIIAQAVTGSDGGFQFSHLPDGRFQLSASHRGYIESAYQEHEGGISTAIVAGPGIENTGLQLTLPPDCALYGAITEDSGDPVPRAHLSLYHAPEGRGATGRLTIAGVAYAGEMGHFDIDHLAPGTYYLCATGTPWYSQSLPGSVDRRSAGSPSSALDLAYPVSCYPDGTDPSGAQPIVLNPGDRLPIDLVMHPVAAVHLFFQIPAPVPGRGFDLPQLHQEVFGNSDFVQSGFTFESQGNPQDPGATATVEVGGIAPGQYQFDLTSNASSGQTTRTTTIDAASGDIHLDASSLAVLPALSGKVVLPGGIPRGFGLVLVSQNAGQDNSGNLFAHVDPDGSFHIDSVHPGSYEIDFYNGGGPPLDVTRLAATGASVQGRVLQIGSARVTLTVDAAPANASIYGKVQIGGKPAPGVFVLLVPASPGAGRNAWLPNQSDSDGSFDFPHVPAGNYILVAIQQGWTLAWSRPEVLDPYLEDGIPISIPTDSTRITLKAPLQAQPK
ncbi:MAG TPA: carboxypeptidase regulatory-like domain-containing protein [Terracidiphilus sp.]|nr:carboxypeptidase regulatory-like domain-containing protein [Terracidiphilus sp.]